MAGFPHIGAYVSPDVMAHKPTGIVSTDGPMLAQAIADTPAGGWLYLPGGGDTSYAIDQTLVISQPMKMTGAGVFPVCGSQASNSDAVSGFPISLLGTVILQTATDIDIINVNVTGQKVDLFDIGMEFNTKYVSTGHGISATPAAIGANYDNGLLHQVWERLIVWGHDGDHYGFQIINTLYGTHKSLRAFGGGGLHLITNSANGLEYGGLEDTGCFYAVAVAGTAHGIFLDAQNSILGGLAFVRPQVGVGGYGLTGVAEPTAAQYTHTYDGNLGSGLSYINADFESGGINTHIALFPGQARFFMDPGGYVSSPYTQDSAGGTHHNFSPFMGSGDPNNQDLVLGTGFSIYNLLNKPTGNAVTNLQNLAGAAVPDANVTPGDLLYTDGSNRIAVNRLGTATFSPAATVAAGTGAGTSPPAPVAASGTLRDMNGRISIGTGTAPAAGALCEITFSQTLGASDPTVMLTAENQATQALGLYVTPTTTGFTINAANAPAASQALGTYLVSYVVIGQ